jgi:HSP20 family protein
MRSRQWLVERPRSGWDFFRDVDEIFNQLASTQNNGMLSAADEESSFRPPIDVRENDKGYLLAMDVPGVSENDVKIEIKDGVLNVSGERKRESKTTTEEGWTRTERSFGRFTRSFALPKDVDAQKIEAQVEHGELHLFLPKGEAVKPLSVPIKKTAQGETGAVKGLMERFFSSKNVDQKQIDEKTQEQKH